MNGEINWMNVTELRNVGQLLCKYENQATKNGTKHWREE